MRRMTGYGLGVAVGLTMLGAMLSVPAARAGTISYTGPATIFYFPLPICVPPMNCGGSAGGVFTPPDLNPFLDQSSPGILLTGLTTPTSLVYSANPADDGQLVTLRWRSSRLYDASGCPPCPANASAQLDGSVVYDATKFSVTEFALQTNFLDFPGAATVQIAPVPSGVPFNQTSTGPAVDLPLGPGTLTGFLALTFQQINATPSDTITVHLPSSAFSTIVPAVSHTGPPVDKDECKNDGWKRFDVPRRFKSQGDCIQFVNTGK